MPAQREACMRYIDDHKWSFINEYCDAGESARTANRPAFQKMLKDMVVDEIDVVVLHKLDRLARNIEDYAAVRAQFRRAGVELVSVSENLEASASGKLVEGILASLSEWYSNNLSTEVKKGLNAKVKAGGYPHKAPIGYKNVRVEGNGRNEAVIVPDEAVAPLVAKAFELYASGEYTLTELHEEMHSRGLPVSRSGLALFLKNPVFTGRIAWKGAIVDGNHEAIVSLRDFTKVQQLLDLNNTAGDRSWKYAHYLKGGPLKCGTCGSQLSYMIVKRKNAEYMFCLGRHQKRTGCEEPYAPLASLESQVGELFRQIKIPRRFYEEIRQELETQIALREENRAGATLMLGKRLQALSKKREKLLQLWYEDAIDLAKFKSEQERIDVEMTALSQELELETDDLHQTRDVLDMAVKLAKNVGRSFEKATPEVKKLWLRAFFEEIRVSDRQISGIKYRPPFDGLLGSSDTPWIGPTKDGPPGRGDVSKPEGGAVEGEVVQGMSLVPALAGDGVQRMSLAPALASAIQSGLNVTAWLAWWDAVRTASELLKQLSEMPV